MVKMNNAFTKHAVYRMYQLGLDEPSILKIFALYDTEPLVATLKHYKLVQRNIPKEFFFAKLNKLQDFEKRTGGWEVWGDIYKANHEQEICK